MARRIKNEDMFRDGNNKLREIKKYLEKFKLSASELEEMLLDFLEKSYEEDYDIKRKRYLH